MEIPNYCSNLNFKSTLNVFFLTFIIYILKVFSVYNWREGCILGKSIRYENTRAENGIFSVINLSHKDTLTQYVKNTFEISLIKLVIHDL